MNYKKGEASKIKFSTLLQLNIIQITVKKMEMTEGQKLSPQTGTSSLKINFIFFGKKHT